MSSPLSIVIRVDASARMGTGHVMRCLTLADLLRERGAAVGFVCRRHPGHMIDLLRKRGHRVAALPAPAASVAATDGPPGEDYAAWTGVSQVEEAEQTVAALDGEHPDWIVVDHYGLDGAWESAVRPHAGGLLAIDDLANRAHRCEVLVDQNFSDEGSSRYEKWVSGACTRLVGPEYALLRPEYAARRRTLARRDGTIRRVVVFFGGSDPDDMTSLALDAVIEAGWDDVDLEIVVGANYAHRGLLDRKASRRPRTVVLQSLPHLADLMARADLVIGAGGSTNLERVCLAVPSVVISIAENQRHNCQALERRGAIRYLGHVGSVTAADLATELRRLQLHPECLRAMSTTCWPLVDGLGAARVAGVLLAMRKSAQGNP
jgi:UDP-2,4-diacetamido-2,4,6-trideoxy-beta-L-altropyranose hydrolase